MVKRLIGSDTTGTDGSVSIPYNGTGAGLVNLSVETEIDGSIVSETLPVWDTLFFDDATSESNKWQNYADRLTVTPSDDGTTLFRDANTGSGYYLMYNPTTSQLVSFTTPFIIEFEIDGMSASLQCGIDFAVGSTDNNRNFRDMGLTNGDSVKIVYDGTTIKTYKNGGSTSTDIPLSISDSLHLGFFITPTNSMTFKNLKVYSA